jgi:hypothetical protein
MKRLLIAWSLIAALPVWAGVLYFSQDYSSTGLYTLSTTTGQATWVGTSGVSGSTVGLAVSDQAGQLFGSEPFGLGRINTDGSGASYVGSEGIEGLEYVAATGTLYGAINGQFFTLNQSTGAILVNLASPGADVEGLAYGGGYIYGLAGWSGPRGDLYRYDIGANSWAFVGNAGILFNEPGLAYDPIMGWLYPGTPLSLEDARRLVQGYVEHYNNVRLNSAIGYITPKDMLAGRQQEIHAERDRKLEAARQHRQRRRTHVA